MIIKKSISYGEISDKKQTKWPRLYVFLFLFGVVGLLSYTIFRSEYLPGDDWAYHLARIEGIKDGILLGEFPVKIHAFLLNGYGYGNGLFYPSFFLYIPAFFRTLRLDLISSYKAFALIIIIATCFSTYLCAKYILHDRYASMYATLLFCVSHMIIANIYWRSALGEMLAAIFLPVVICGVYNLICEEFSKPWIIILGYTGLMLSHTISLAIVLLCTFIAVIVNFRIFLKKAPAGKELTGRSGGRKLIMLLISAALVLLLTLSFWLPLAEQMLSDKFQYQDTFLHVSESSLKIGDLLLFYKASLGIPLAVFTCIAVLIRLISLFQKTERKLLLWDIFLLTGILFAFIATDLFPWKYVEFLLNPIQFPWRFLTIASLFLAFGIAGICSRLMKSTASKVCLLSIITVVCAVFCVSMINIRWNVFHTEVTSRVEAEVYLDPDAAGVGQEWLPLHTDLSLLVDPAMITTNDGDTLEADKKGNTLSFLQDGKHEVFDVPLIFYKGYTAQIMMADSVASDLQVVKTPNNTVRILNPENLSGVITVRYSGTLTQKISNFVSVITFLIILAVILNRTLRHPQKFKKSVQPSDDADITIRKQNDTIGDE